MAAAKRKTEEKKDNHGRQVSAAAHARNEERQAERDLAATDESNRGGRIKALGPDADFEYAKDHLLSDGDGPQPGDPDGPAVVWNPYAGAFVIDRDEPQHAEYDGPAGAGHNLSPVLPQGDPDATDAENLAASQEAVDAADTTPAQLPAKDA